MKQTYTLQPTPHPARQRAKAAIDSAPDWYVVSIRSPTRTLEQNAALWATLGDVSNQVDWYGQRLSPEEWKHVFSAALEKQKVVPGLDGGFVVLGKSTSSMTKSQLSNLLDLIGAFCAEHGVKLQAGQL